MVNNKKKYVSPLLCWDIYSEYYHKLIQKARIDFDLKHMEIALRSPLQPSVINTIKEEAYDALVVTDAFQQFVWVSRGFSEMTGYPKSYVIGKTPHFLQGSKTSNKSRKRIREQLKTGDCFTDSILNYRKNGEEYLCQIKILPILDKENSLSHYLAIEKELQIA